MKLSLYLNRLDTFIDFEVKIPRGWDLLCALKTCYFARCEIVLGCLPTRRGKIKLNFTRYWRHINNDHVHGKYK